MRSSLEGSALPVFALGVPNAIGCVFLGKEEESPTLLDVRDAIYQQISIHTALFPNGFEFHVTTERGAHGQRLMRLCAVSSAFEPTLKLSQVLPAQPSAQAMPP